VSLDEIEPLNMYISSVCITLLSENQDVFHKAIHSEANQAIMTKFSTDSAVKTLIISKLKGAPAIANIPSDQTAILPETTPGKTISPV